MLRVDQVGADFVNDTAQDLSLLQPRYFCELIELLFKIMGHFERKAFARDLDLRFRLLSLGL